MTESEKLVGVCEDCKHLIMFHMVLMRTENQRENFIICALSDDEVRLNHTCEEYEEE